MKNKVLNAVLVSVPPLFLYGWIVSRDFFDDDSNFLFLTIVATLLTIILLAVLRKVNDLVLVVPLLLLFSIFILAYYIKFFILIDLIINNEEDYIKYLGSPYIVDFISKYNLLRSYELATYGYAAFCFAAILSLYIKLKSNPYNLMQDISFDFSSNIYIVNYLSVCFILILISSSLSFNYRVGIHGGEAQILPYKLNAFIYYFRMLSFYFILLIISWTDNDKNRILWIMSIGILAFYAISQIIVEASRGALMSSFAIPLGLLWFVDKKFSSRRWIFVLSFIALTMILRPVFTVYRIIQNNFDLGVISNIKELYNYKNYLDIGSMEYQKIYYLFYELLFRIIGVDSVLFFSNIPDVKIDIPWIVSVLLGTESFTGRFTQEIVGYGHTVTTHYAAPSLIGGLYWMGGVLGIITGVMIITIVSQFLWSRVINSNWLTSRLILLIIIFTLFRIGIEGNFDAIIREVSVSVVIVLCFEIIVRKYNPIKNDHILINHAIC